MINPEASLGTLVGVRWELRLAICWVGLLEEFTDNEGFVEGLAFVFESGDEAFGVNFCTDHTGPGYSHDEIVAHSNAPRKYFSL